MRSPKHKFRAELSFPKPIEGVGSVVSYTGEDLALLKALVESEVKRYKSDAYIVIRENKEVYPKFDWQIIERYER